MKKLLLTILALSITVGVYAQSNRLNKNELTQKNKAPNDTELRTSDGPVKANTTYKTVAATQTQTNAKSAAISVVPMGHAANAFGSISPRTQIDAVPGLNSVALIHRSTTGTQTPPGMGSGYYLYDLSTDGGATFTANVGPIYDPTDTIIAPFANGRYPQGVIYNPPGNTDPMNASWSWIGPTLTGENGGSWGSYAYGSAKLDGSGMSQRQLTGAAANGAHYEVAEDFAKGLPGEVWMVQASVDFNAANPAYSDTVLALVGAWNGATGDYDYTERLILLPASADVGVAYVSIAFSANGMTGYLSALSHFDFAAEPDTVLTLVTIKTTDGGVTWGAPIQVDISSIADPFLLSDPNSSYTTGFEMKTAVDMNGNLHAIMAVGPDGVGTAINTAFGDWGIFQIYTTDGGTNWDGMLLGTPHQFRGLWDPAGNALEEDSRPFISTTPNHEKLFFSWLDTDSTVFGTAEGNAHPDLWMVGYNVTTGLSTVATNLTTGSAADGEVSYGCASKYCFEPTAGNYEIPYCYMVNDPSTAATDVKPFNYIKGIEFSDADFVVGINDINNDLGTLTAAYPNPMDNVSYLDLNLDVKANVVVTITNSVGQIVRTEDKGTLSAGTYKLAVEKDGLSAGLYVVNVSLNQSTLSQKLIIQ